MVVAAILPISAFLLCFIHRVRGSRGCGNHSRVLLCFIQKVCGSRGCITYVRVLYFVLYKTYRVSALTSYISATYHIFNTKGLHELQLYLRIAFPLYKNHPLTAVLLATFFSYIQNVHGRTYKHTSIYYFLYKNSISILLLLYVNPMTAGLAGSGPYRRIAMGGYSLPTF